MPGPDVLDSLQDNIWPHEGVSRSMAEHLLDCPSFQVVCVLNHIQILRKLEKESLVALWNLPPFAVTELQVGPAPVNGAKLQVPGPGLGALTLFPEIQGGAHLTVTVIPVKTESSCRGRPAICRLRLQCCNKIRIGNPPCSSIIQNWLKELMGLEMARHGGQPLDPDTG